MIVVEEETKQQQQQQQQIPQLPQIEYRRSQVELEFGIENKSGHMTCFLNSAMQLIWTLLLDEAQVGLVEFVKLPLDKGPLVLRPLIESL